MREKVKKSYRLHAHRKERIDHSDRVRNETVNLNLLERIYDEPK